MKADQVFHYYLCEDRCRACSGQRRPLRRPCQHARFPAGTGNHRQVFEHCHHGRITDDRGHVDTCRSMYAGWEDQQMTYGFLKRLLAFVEVAAWQSSKNLRFAGCPKVNGVPKVEVVLLPKARSCSKCSAIQLRLDVSGRRSGSSCE